ASSPRSTRSPSGRMSFSYRSGRDATRVSGCSGSYADSTFKLIDAYRNEDRLMLYREFLGGNHHRDGNKSELRRARFRQSGVDPKTPTLYPSGLSCLSVLILTVGPDGPSGDINSEFVHSI